MAVITNPTLAADVVAYLQEEVLPITRKQLVAYQFGNPLRLDKGRGLTYTASRYIRFPLPFQPLTEAVPITTSQSLVVQQVTATAQQWGDRAIVSDVAEMTIFHPPFQTAKNLIELQMAETLERNSFNALMSGTQVNFVNTRGSRAALIAGDILDPTTVARTTANLRTIGAPRFMGDEQTNEMKGVDEGGGRASDNPRAMPHYAAIVHTNVVGDFRTNSTVSTAWSYSDTNRLYNYEIGEWAGMRFCESNMVPTFTGVAQINGTTGTAGALATGTYYVQVTASDTQNQYESRIYQVSASVSVTGPTGSISVVLPTLAGYTFNVYVGTAASPTNLGLCAAGPSSGPFIGQAVQLAGNQTVVITNLGLAQTPPAAPATGVTVYPTFVFGRDAYGQVVLDDPRFEYLDKADKSDMHNQLRAVTWKIMYGTIILNQQFFARIESSSSIPNTFG